MFESLIDSAISQEVQKKYDIVKERTDAYFAEMEKKEAEAAAAAAAAQRQSNARVVTYDISSRGDIGCDLEEFRRIVKEVFNDSRGWMRAGVRFEEVSSGGKLHMVLATPQEVYNASPWGCSTEWSCTVKPSVYINTDRWLYSTDSYNSLGRSLMEYRQMVINHEVGHWLGHNHIEQCEAGTGLSPIMNQQSISMKGCGVNPWPLEDELWVNF